MNGAKSLPQPADKTPPGGTAGAQAFPGPMALWLLVAFALVAASLIGFRQDRGDVVVAERWLDTTPVTITRTGQGPQPVVLIAHGFAGSRQLMQAFAYTLARNGMTAVSFDFLGHGRHPLPLGGSVTRISGATQSLVGQTRGVLALARTIGDGRVALLGHSMASDILVRVARAEQDVVATVAISAFSREITETEPRNLLLVAGAWESRLAAEARRIVALRSTPAVPEQGVTYGDHGDGSARRFAIAPHVEHVGVLYSAASLSEARDWLRASFGVTMPAHRPDRGGLWIIMLLAGLIIAVRPLSRLLPLVSAREAGAALPWRSFWPVLVLPALLTPLVLRVSPTRVLPILVADYLAFHFALYGALTWLMLVVQRRRAVAPPDGKPAADRLRLGLAALGACLVAVLPLFIAIDAYVTAIRPIEARLVLALCLVGGAASFFFATEWASGGSGAARGGSAAIAVAFLLSLLGAVLLDPGRLFFLAIIVPVIVPFMIVFGLIAWWIRQRTRHPFPGAAVKTLAFGLAIAATFPMMTG
jgi:hypothetical protein